MPLEHICEFLDNFGCPIVLGLRKNLSCIFQKIQISTKALQILFVTFLKYMCSYAHI